MGYCNSGWVPRSLQPGFIHNEIALPAVQEWALCTDSAWAWYEDKTEVPGQVRSRSARRWRPRLPRCGLTKNFFLMCILDEAGVGLGPTDPTFLCQECLVLSLGTAQSNSLLSGVYTHSQAPCRPPECWIEGKDHVPCPAITPNAAQDTHSRWALKRSLRPWVGSNHHPFG